MVSIVVTDDLIILRDLVIIQIFILIVFDFNMKDDFYDGVMIACPRYR